MVKFISLGGADEIGASSYYLNIYGTGLLVDCGIHPRESGLNAIPDFDRLKDLPLDALLITHAHQDHIGAIPFLIKKYPHVKIYSTPQTRDIARLTLNNAVSIIKKQESANNNFNAYTYEEVELLVKSVRDYSYQESFDVTGLLGTKKIMATFVDAGHILGSASLLLEFDGQKMFFTGDINLSPQVIMNGAELPKGKVDVIITESTYGSSESDLLNNWQIEAERLTKFINNKINRGGSVFIPVFSLGKMQEMLLLINLLMEKKKIVEVPIYTAGLGLKISELYDKNRYLVRRNFPDVEIRKLPQNEVILPGLINEVKKTPSIVLSSSGMMLEGTHSYEIGKYWVREKNFGIAIVGYMDPATPGYRFSRIKMGEKFRITDFSEEVTNFAEIKKFYFTSHSKREELLDIIKKLNPGKVVIVHGEEKSRDWLGHQVLNKFGHIKVFSPNRYQQIFLG